MVALSKFAAIVSQTAVLGSFFIQGAQAASNVLVRRQGTATDTASASSLTPTPILTFGEVPLAVSCAPLHLSWFYAGPADNINLVVTNVGVSQDDPPPDIPENSVLPAPANPTATGASNPKPVSDTIARNVRPQSLAFTWSAVNVTQGWYIISAQMPSQSYTQLTDNFFVYRGTNTNCLTTATTPVTTSTTHSTPHHSATDATTPLVDAIGGASVSNSGMKPGAIIGICLGVAALISLIIALLLWRRRRQKAAKNNGNLKALSRNWDQMGSVESRNVVGGGDARAQHAVFPSSRSPRHHHSQADSLGTIAGGSEESMEKTKAPFDESTTAISTLPVLHHKAGYAPSQTYSAEEDPSNRTRRLSQPRRSMDYPPTSPFSSESPSPSPLPPSESPIPPQSAGGKEPATARRQSFSSRKRKPVPNYDPRDESVLPTPPPGPPSSFPTSPSYQTLGHKTSFGHPVLDSKPMHILIPDMPLPQKE